jgi:hypothetical protein
MYHRMVLISLAALTSPLSAQMAPPLARAAASITPRDVAQRIGIIADDSMMGRDTPSRGLEQTAQYVAAQFRQFELRPGGDDGGWLQRYAITRRRLDLKRSRIVFTAGPQRDTAALTSAAKYEGGAMPAQAVEGTALLVGGAQTAETAKRIDVHDKVVIYAAPERLESEQIQEVLRTLFRAGPRALIVVSDRDSADFAATLPTSASVRTVVGSPSGPVAVQVREGAVRTALRAAQADLASVRRSGEPIAHALPALVVSIELKDSITSATSAPNTVGILEGSDPTLKHEYLVYSAHMDHIGITPGQPDSINNGADDDGSGTVGVIELAEAFSRAGARPKRSIIFLTVSGEEKGLWGSKYFSEHPAVPIKQIVADLNIDMIGRNWPDTIVAIGKEHSDLGATLNQVNAAHRELGMTAIDDRWPEEQFYFRSDHYNFARKGVPILFFFNGVHPDYHEVTDSPDKINSEKEARILRLLFYLGQEIANAPERPKWRPESYKEIVEP